MGDANSIIDTLSDEELDLLNNDSEMLAAFKAKHVPSVTPEPIQPSLMDQAKEVAPQAVKSALMAPFRAGKALLTDPTKVAAETPILPVGGAIAAGPAGGAVGEGLRQVAQITRGAPAPTLLQSAIRMTGAALVPSAARQARAAVTTMSGAQKAIQTLKEQAGVNVDKAVEPLTKKVATPVVNALTNLRKSGGLKKLPIQDLHEAEVQIRNLLDAEKVGGFARIMGKQPAGRLTDQGVALAAKAKAAIIAEQNARVKGLKSAREMVGTIARQNRLAKLVGGATAAYALKKTLGGAAAPVAQAASEVTR